MKPLKNVGLFLFLALCTFSFIFLVTWITDLNLTVSGGGLWMIPLGIITTIFLYEEISKSKKK